MSATQFSHGFGLYVCEGDSISVAVEGFTITATVERDNDSGPPEDECDGFWPSLDPQSDGYIGPKSKSTLARYMAHAQHVADSWKADDWFYCGIVLSVSKAGVELDDHAASLWCCEANYPHFDKRRPHPNEYLLEVANDMIGEALDSGKARLAALCDCHEKLAA